MMRLPLSISLAILLSQAAPSTSEAPDRITVTPQDGASVIHSETYKAFGLKKPLSIKSVVPVSMIRFSDSSVDGGMNVVGMNDIYVYLKTDCDNLVEDSITLEAVKNRNGVAEEIMIKSSVPVTSNALPDSDFTAAWTTYAMICDDELSKLTSFVTLVVRDQQHPESPIVEAELVAEDTPGEGANDRRHLQGACNVTAEILYDGCQTAFSVIAPLVKVSNAGLNISNTVKDGCAYNKTASMPITFVSQGDGGALEVEKLVGDVCLWPMAGRPFYDVDGAEVKAHAVVVGEGGENEAVWSKRGDTTFDVGARGRSDFSSQWIERSLAEHASIASFAGFTISLMTNNAPPDLIRDALRAALDEVDHATTSFEMASILAGETIEPGPLPQSSHEFANDIGTLMKGTFSEGCIDETLSALAAAAEADSYSPCDDDSEADGYCGLEGELKTRLTKIAFDEARHSALAWRTISWACGVDAASCTDNIESYLQDDLLVKQLSEAPGKAFPLLHSEFESEWRTIHKTLLPFVITGRQGDDTDSMCSEYVSASKLEGVVGSGLSLVKVISDRIAHEVLCGSSVKQHRQDTLSPLSE